MALNMSYVHEFVCRGRFRGRGLESITRLWSRNRRRVNKAGTRNPRTPLPLRTHLDECEDFESCLLPKGTKALFSSLHVNAKKP